MTLRTTVPTTFRANVLELAVRTTWVGTVELVVEEGQDTALG